MAKKKSAKKTTKAVAKKSHGELFDKHPNLIWLLPIFFIIAAIAVLAIRNMNTSVVVNEEMMYENEMMDDGTMMDEEITAEDVDLMYEDDMMPEESSQ